MKKLVLILVLVFASLAQAREVLDVVFVFDRTSLSLSSAKRNNLANEYIKKLNNSFFYSKINDRVRLSNYIYFRKKAVLYRPVSRKGEGMLATMNRYMRNMTDKTNPKPKLSLHYVQKYYKADIVIAIMNDPNEKKYAAVSLGTPEKSDRLGKRNTNFLSYGDLGISIYNYKEISKQKEIFAHEIGHGFGLYHGKAVARKYKNESGHYEPRNALKPYANGFGDTDYWRNYGTLMAGRYLTGVEKAIENKFSNPDIYECGYYGDDEVCGDSTANAVKFIKDNARYFNKRGNWYDWLKMSQEVILLGFFYK